MIDNQVLDGNKRFSGKFLDFGNSDDHEARFSGVNEAMDAIAPQEYAHIAIAQEGTEKQACVTQQCAEENVKRNCVSFSVVVDRLVEDCTPADIVKADAHGIVTGRIRGQQVNRSMENEQATVTSAVQSSLASVGMGCITKGGHAREAATSVDELKVSRNVPVDFYEALKEHNAILLEEKNNETFNLQPRKYLLGQCG